MLSHKLLLKSGYISQLSAGIFSFTPMGWRVISNIKKIIDDEMEKINCFELNLPVIQPSDIWMQSERIDSFIPPLASFLDRRDKKMIIAPTHEEAVIDLVKNYLRSFRDLPFSAFANSQGFFLMCYCFGKISNCCVCSGFCLLYSNSIIIVA